MSEDFTLQNIEEKSQFAEIFKRIKSNKQNVDQILEKEKFENKEWLAAHFLHLVRETNVLLGMLLEECTKDKCSKMHATLEQVYVCGAHGLINNPKYFHCHAMFQSYHNLDVAQKVILKQVESGDQESKQSGLTFDQHQRQFLKRCQRILIHAQQNHKAIQREFENKFCTSLRFTRLIQLLGMKPENDKILIKDEDLGLKTSEDNDQSMMVQESSQDAME